MHEGPEKEKLYKPPAFSYTTDGEGITGCGISGGAFYPRSGWIRFPRRHMGDYFFADSCAGWIGWFDPGSRKNRIFATGLDRPVALTMSSKGDLLYAEEGGAVHKVKFGGWVDRTPGPAYLFHPLIRIGDDIDYNLHHSWSFIISSPAGKNYKASFDLPADAKFKRAEIRGQIAGAYLDNLYFMNGTLFGTTVGCKGNNYPDIKLTCIPVEIPKKLLKKGQKNILELRTVPLPSDPLTPLDDMEVFNLRLQLVR